MYRVLNYSDTDGNINILPLLKRIIQTGIPVWIFRYSTLFNQADVSCFFSWPILGVWLLNLVQILQWRSRFGCATAWLQNSRAWASSWPEVQDHRALWSLVPQRPGKFIRIQFIVFEIWTKNMQFSESTSTLHTSFQFLQYRFEIQQVHLTLFSLAFLKVLTLYAWKTTTGMSHSIKQSFCENSVLTHTMAFLVNQVGGWVTEYGNLLTFATVRGAAHMVPYAQPSRALHLFSSFVHGRRMPNTTHTSIDD